VGSRRIDTELNGEGLPRATLRPAWSGERVACSADARFVSRQGEMRTACQSPSASIGLVRWTAESGDFPGFSAIEKKDGPRHERPGRGRTHQVGVTRLVRAHQIGEGLAASREHARPRSDRGPRGGHSSHLRRSKLLKSRQIRLFSRFFCLLRRKPRSGPPGQETERPRGRSLGRTRQSLQRSLCTSRAKQKQNAFRFQKNSYPHRRLTLLCHTP
jgi:hypothetical protein